MQSVLTAGSLAASAQEKSAGIVKAPADQFSSEAGAYQLAIG
jgi:hypothetical protein